MSDADILELQPDQEAPAAPPSECADDGCRNCGAPRDSNLSVCRKCGYYERLGTIVELDEYDRDESEEQDAQPALDPAQWLTIVPRWGWMLLACLVSVVVMSVLVRLVTPAEGTLRTTWSLSQLGVGCATFLVLHLLAYVVGIMESDQINLLDIFLRPLRCWMPTLQKLPDSFPRVALAGCALTAMVCSPLVIGGLPYDKLWDWGIKEQAKPNLLGAVVELANEAEAQDKSLEEAVGDFAKGAPEPEQPPPPPKPEVAVDCVIVGFTPSKDREGDFQTLVLATEVNKKLKIVGHVWKGIPPDVRAQLNERLPQLVRQRPLIPSDLPAHWVELRLVCRVMCLSQDGGGGLVGAEFDRMLAELDLP